MFCCAQAQEWEEVERWWVKADLWDKWQGVNYCLGHTYVCPVYVYVYIYIYGYWTAKGMR